MKKGMLLLIVVISSYCCTAQTHGHATPEDIIENFFAVYERAGLKTSLDTVFAYGDKDVVKALSYIKDTLAGTVKAIGQKFNGYELITSKNVTKSYAYYSYLLKYPTSPLRVNLIFYKPQDKWVLIDFSFDSQLVPETRDLIKLH